jgi:hypothetical protein
LLLFLHQIFVTFPGQADILLAGFLRLLLETVQDIYRLGQLRQVHDPESAGFISDANFFDALADSGHELPIVRFRAALHLVQLEPGFLPGTVWEGAQGFE